MEDMVLVTREEFAAICPWTYNNKVPVPLLFDWDDPLRHSADVWIEAKLGGIVSEALGTTVTHHSAGKFPAYDLVFADRNKIEIKIRSFINNGLLFIETAKEYKTPREIAKKTKVKRKKQSGLSLSTSDYYICLNPGTFKGEVVMKVRIIPTYILKHLQATTVETHISVDADGRKTYGFEIDLMDPDFKDGCIGHFEYDQDTKTVDFSSLNPYKNQMPQAVAAYKNYTKTKDLK